MSCGVVHIGIGVERRQSREPKVDLTDPFVPMDLIDQTDSNDPDGPDGLTNPVSITDPYGSDRPEWTRLF